MLKVLFIIADFTGCGHYRCIRPSDVLNEYGLAKTDYSVAIYPEHIRYYDLFVFQRSSSLGMQKVVEMLKKHNRPIIYEIDDDIFTIPWGNQAAYFFTNARKKAAKNILRLADAVITTTPFLKKKIEKNYNKRVYIIPNFLDRSLWRPISRDKHKGLYVGWAGTTTHFADLQPFIPVIKQVLNQNDVKMRFIGYIPPEFIPEQDLGEFQQMMEKGSMENKEYDMGNNISFIPFGPYDQYPEKLAKIDIGLAPIEDNQFNRSKCLDAETRISSNRGIVPIGEIEIGDKVWNDGRWVEVLAINREKPIVGLEIEVKSGRKLRLTKNHRLWVENRGWTYAEEINKDEVIKLSPDNIGQKKIQEAHWPSDGRISRQHKYNEFMFINSEDAPIVKITERWARILGVFMGDGHVYRNGTCIVISCDGQDQDFIDLLMEDFKAIGLYPSTENIKTWSGEILRRREIRVSSTHFIRFLKSIGAIKDGKRNVCVPEVIWRSPKKVISSFLSGVYEADGTVANGTPKIIMKQEQFIRDLQRLLTSFGIETWIKSKWNKCQSGNKYLYWELRMRRAGGDIFEKEIGFLSERKKALLNSFTKKDSSNARLPVEWKDKIVSIKKCSLNPVDIQVEGSVFAAAGLLSHNSDIKILEYNYLGIPAVCSKVENYIKAQQDGAAVMIAKNPGQWIRHLNKLIRDDSFRKEMSLKGKKWASHRWLQDNIGMWMEVFQNVMKGYKTAYEIFGKQSEPEGVEDKEDMQKILKEGREIVDEKEMNEMISLWEQQDFDEQKGRRTFA